MLSGNEKYIVGRRNIPQYNYTDVDMYHLTEKKRIISVSERNVTLSDNTIVPNNKTQNYSMVVYSRTKKGWMQNCSERDFCREYISGERFEVIRNRWFPTDYQEFEVFDDFATAQEYHAYLSRIVF